MGPVADGFDRGVKQPISGSHRATITERREEGRTEGQAELLWVLLTQRWGALPAEARAKIIMLAGTPGAAGQLAALGNVTTRDEVLRRLELT